MLVSVGPCRVPKQSPIAVVLIGCHRRNPVACGVRAISGDGSKAGDQSRQVVPFTTNSESFFLLQDGCTLQVSRLICALFAP